VNKYSNSDLRHQRRNTTRSKGVFDALHCVTVRLAAIIRPIPHPPYVSLQSDAKANLSLSPEPQPRGQSERYVPGLQL